MVTANPAGVCHPSRECGRVPLYSARQAKQRRSAIWDSFSDALAFQTLVDVH